MAIIKKYLEHTPLISVEAYLAETAVIIGKVSIDDTIYGLPRIIKIHKIFNL